MGWPEPCSSSSYRGLMAAMVNVLFWLAYTGLTVVNRADPPPRGLKSTNSPAVVLLGSSKPAKEQVAVMKSGRLS